MVGIFTNEGAAELAQCQMQAVAGVVLQGNMACGCRSGIQISIGSVGDELVAVAVDIEVASAYFWVVLVELVEFLSLRAPARLGHGFIQLQRNGLCQAVGEF